MNNARSVLFAIALFVCLASPISAQETVYPTFLGEASFADLAALELPERPPRVRRHALLPPFGAAGPVPSGTLAPLPDAGPAIRALPMRVAFTSGTSRTFVPADASGAVGKSHVVGMYNNAVIVHERSGKVAGAMPLDNFWSTPTDFGDHYDPRIAYDSTHDRWVAMVVDDEEALVFAVSRTGDPTGTWSRWRLGFDGAPVDFSRLAITRDTVVLGTWDMSGNVASTVLLSVPKSEAYAGIPVLSVRRYRYYDNPGVVPAHGESSATEWIVSQRFGVISAGRLGDPAGLRRTASSGSVVTPHMALPQLGGPPLDPGGGWFENAVYRDGSIYAVATTDAGGQLAVAWARIDPEALTATWSTVADPAGEISYAYPSIAVNANGTLLIGFGTFSSTHYPSAAYVHVDTLGRASAPTIIKAGDSPSTTGGERWGDYTTTVADPTDPASFWTVQMCTNQRTWGTVWAKVEDSPSVTRRRAVRH